MKKRLKNCIEQVYDSHLGGELLVRYDVKSKYNVSKGLVFNSAIWNSRKQTAIITYP